MAEMLLNIRCSQMTANFSAEAPYLVGYLVGYLVALFDFDQHTLNHRSREGKGSVSITSQIPELIICLQRFVPSPTATRIASP